MKADKLIAEDLDWPELELGDFEWICGMLEEAFQNELEALKKDDD